MRLEDIIPSYSSNNTFTSAFSLPVVNPANENSAIYTNIYEPGKLTDSKNMLCILYITMLYLFSILYKFIFQQLDLLHQEQILLQKLQIYFKSYTVYFKCYAVYFKIPPYYSKYLNR